MSEVELVLGALAAALVRAAEHRVGEPHRQTAAPAGAVREQLLKVAARVTFHARRVRVTVATSATRAWTDAWEALGMLPAHAVPNG